MKTVQRLLILGSIVLAGVLYYAVFLGKHATAIHQIGGR